jgi:DNA-binding GntR family transcriptional regulator
MYHISVVTDGAYRPTTATRALIDELRREIYAGRLAPGTRLRQGELASRFGVSTTPVREALSALQAEGLINVDPHRGAVVFDPNRDDVLESFEIREELESLAVRHAIAGLDEARVAELQGLIDEMRATTVYEDWAPLNEAFHKRLYAASNRPRLCDLIDSMRRSSRYYIHLAVSDQVVGEAVDAEHQAILDACKAGDVAAATAALRKHIQSTAAQVLKRLENDTPAH